MLIEVNWSWLTLIEPIESVGILEFIGIVGSIEADWSYLKFIEPFSQLNQLN